MVCVELDGAGDFILETCDRLSDGAAWEAARRLGACPTIERRDPVRIRR